MAMEQNSKKVLEGLVSIAEALDFEVIFKRSSEMAKSDEGLMCPDLNKIFVDPKSDKHDTLAHEIAHVLLMYANAPGHNADLETEKIREAAENAADDIAKALLAALGHNPKTFETATAKGVKSLMAWALHVYGKIAEPEVRRVLVEAYALGYCKAAQNLLPYPGVVQLKDLLDSLSRLTTEGKALKQVRKKDGDEVQTDGVRVPLAHRPGKSRRGKHSRGKNKTSGSPRKNRRLCDRSRDYERSFGTLDRIRQTLQRQKDRAKSAKHSRHRTLRDRRTSSQKSQSKR
jgi:hypothetical protein